MHPSRRLCIGSRRVSSVTPDPPRQVNRRSRAHGAGVIDDGGAALRASL
jgi:hypothetical protein